MQTMAIILFYFRFKPFLQQILPAMPQPIPINFIIFLKNVHIELKCFLDFVIVIHVDDILH